MEQTIENHVLSVMGQEWNIRVQGPENAERTLLLCNGIGASVETIGPFAKHFKKTRLIAFDVPGVGASPTPALPYRLSNLTRMLSKILDELDVGEVDLFGVSWGGGLAQQFAFDFQDRCRTLTLAATAAGYVMVPGNISVLKKMATPKRYTDPSYMMDVGAEIYGGELRFNQELLHEHTSAMTAGDTRGYVYQLLAAAGWTSYFWLSRIKLPTLILMGNDDPIVPVINGRILERRIPNAILETVDCGHMFVLTQAETIADRIEEFLFEQPAQAA